MRNADVASGGRKRFRAMLIGVLLCSGVVSGQASHEAEPPARRNAPSPAGPYPAKAAGWGPEAGNGRLVSRWAEDWTGTRAAGKAPPLKDIPLGDGASLSLGAESRLRFNAFDNAQLARGADDTQVLFRGVLGADLRFDPSLRVYGEIATGQVEGDRNGAAASFENDASLQQLFVEGRAQLGGCLVGVMVGRQEFADGPRQLLSLGDGPNIHRTWNGLRVYAHGRAWRVGAFGFRATRPERGFFDEEVHDGERVSGLNASFVVAPDRGAAGAFLDPFWIHSEHPTFRSGADVGSDDRDTRGLRFWGRRGDLDFDWTVAHQSGRSRNRDVDAFAAFAVQSLLLSERWWRPRLTAHLDVASGGGTAGPGTVRGFHQLYASSGYLGEGRFISTSNLVFVAPGISMSPTPGTRLSVEYGFARRFTANDAAYGGGMREYPGTRDVRGREIGGLLRIEGGWSVCEGMGLSFGYEHLAAGDVLERARLPSGSSVHFGVTYRW